MTNEQKIKEAKSLKAALMQEIETATPFTAEAIGSINELSDIVQSIEFTDGSGNHVHVGEVLQALELITDIKVGTVTLDVEV